MFSSLFDRRPSPATAIAVLALLVAAGGTSWGATSLLASALRGEQARHKPPGPRGPRGLPSFIGPRGPAGAPGAAALNADLYADRGTGISLDSNFKPVVGSTIAGSTTGGPIQLRQPARIIANADVSAGEDFPLPHLKASWSCVPPRALASCRLQPACIQ